ncbi:elongation factor P hydroxylase [Zhongshania aquimaris]|uniref:Elongation factor P hydroxylase n=1 Tax=Zhongshania aquimaris TaxID=2857107 RepID=A0ABS6VLQ1_9GAMM|nr:elongation factor P hydroxylase [Zhongshania aquimaris]MBW2939238.1 elongation factor P hydroxylase [Zhongshania aquimaris]
MPDANLATGNISTDADLICSVFASCFWASDRTRLLGGGAEPLYRPADEQIDYHQIIFRSDYAASALHEAAHWCIAGEQRRLLLDYGYWYEPDGRGVEQQRTFEAVEAKPQALEWMFSVAAGRQFRVSIDNLDGGAIDPFPFQLAVWQAAHRYRVFGLPRRAALFCQALQAHFRTGSCANADNYLIGKIICN